MDSRQVGHAQRRRIGAAPNIYQDPDFGPDDYADPETFAATTAMREDPRGAAEAARRRIAQMKATPPGTNYGVEVKR